MEAQPRPAQNGGSPCRNSAVRSLLQGFLILAGLALPTWQTIAADAPGAPGAASTWATGAKDFLGTSRSENSTVYFTGAQGVVTEVFYPTVDCPQNVCTQLIVEDSAKTFDAKDAEERLQKRHETSLLDKRAMIWRTITVADNGKWKITKKIFTDPTRDTLIQRVTFETLEPGKCVLDYNVYIYNDPAINGSGGGEKSGPNDTSRTVSGERTMAVARKEGCAASALAVSLPWKTVNGQVMLSNGFVGRSDGFANLFGGASRKTMDWHFDAAVDGNVAQMGWLDFGDVKQTSISFDIVLGFGHAEEEAVASANGTLDSNLDDLEKAYIAGWHDYTRALDDLGGTADDQYDLAAMSLKSVQDKITGAMIAGLGTPWGESCGDENKGGYHLVWARDLFKFASALITAGDTASANRAIDFLFKVQMQQSNADGDHYSRIGRFPQNTFVTGIPFWNSTQMDETAMPIILAWKLHRTDLWPEIKEAADFLAETGPATSQDRWEEMGGFSPSTIAAEVAGLVCAASLAEESGDHASAAAYLEKADAWRNNVANWTFTTAGHYGDGKYYIRIDTEPDPNKPAKITLGNGAGAHDQRDIVDGGFLELVRMGVMSPQDWTIRETLPKYDSILKQTIAGKGDAWFRYNFDGYGEDNKDHPYKGTGRGRLWPIFTAERGIYEISASGTGGAGLPCLHALKAFSTPVGFIPEQVWNNSASITGWETLAPGGHEPGTATRSMCPLSWAMGECINLLAAIHSGHNDAPSVVIRRYSTDKPQIIANFTVNAAPGPRDAVYLLGDDPLMGQGIPTSGVKLAKTPFGYTTTISLPASSTFLYTYAIVPANGGSPVLDAAPKHSFITPSTGSTSQSDRFK